jgi:hypothetical protein
MRNKLSAATMMATTFASMVGSFPWGEGPRDRSLDSVRSARPCLRCGTQHLHNNSFCSVECCRSWEEERKQQSRCQQTNNKPSTIRKD